MPVKAINFAPRRKLTFLLDGRRGYASKFTVTDSRDAIYADPDFLPVERGVNEPEANRAFSYFMVGATGVLGAIGAKSTVMNFLSCWSASSETLAMAQVEVDLSAIPEGKSVVIKWRGKPIFIRHRTASEVEEAASVNVAELRDPQTDADRTQRPEWIVMLGICTHLGCVPLANSGDYNGWYCPCQ
jgi:ubiquinol-cytochrome c reductase iron-sulfur subunit